MRRIFAAMVGRIGWIEDLHLGAMFKSNYQTQVDVVSLSIHTQKTVHNIFNYSNFRTQHDDAAPAEAALFTRVHKLRYLRKFNLFVYQTLSTSAVNWIQNNIWIMSLLPNKKKLC